MIYNKPYTTYAEQLNLMLSRGMQVQDENKALFYLENIGYYRLSGYSYPFREYDFKNQIYLEEFKAHSEFSTVIDLYVFDKKLRLLMLDAIERVEIAVRAQLVETLAQKDPYSYRQPSNFDGRFTASTQYDMWLKKIDDLFERSKEELALNFKTKHPNTYAPIWICAEVWDFGALSKLYEGLKYKDRKLIAQKFNIQEPDIFSSWLKSLNIVRNLCAHHNRLWNKKLAFWPKIPLYNAKLAHCNETNSQTRVYSSMVVLRYLLLTLSPSSHWHVRLKKLIASFPISTHLSLHSMGFPLNWQKLPLWRGYTL